MKNLATPSQVFDEAFLAALRSEYCYNRLVLDESDLRMSVAAAEAAETRNEIARQCFEEIAQAGGEAPAIPQDTQLPLSWTRFGDSVRPGLKLHDHLSDCQEADRELLLCLQKLGDRDMLQRVRETAGKVADLYQERGRFRIPVIARHTPSKPTARTAA